VLRSTSPVKTFIRNRDFFKLPQVLETGADFGMWTFERYQAWMAKRGQWHVAGTEDEAPDREEGEVPSLPPPATAQPAPVSAPATQKHVPPPSGEPTRSGRPIEIEPVEGGLDELIKRLT
jgi:hypothetical protein